MSIAQIIQVAVTPVFLLAGMAGFLNVFATRLGRISDRLNTLADEEAADAPGWRTERMRYLRRRVLALECAMTLIVFSGLATCLATFELFIGTWKAELQEQLLVWFFGSSIVGLALGFIAFLFEVALAGFSMLGQIARDRA